jgi:hypothetical protein
LLLPDVTGRGSLAAGSRKEEIELSMDMSVTEIRKFLSPKNNVDVVRLYYCYHLGSTFVALGLLETRITTAMLMCDRIKLAIVVQNDLSFWDSIAARRDQLQNSTLGNLLNILAKHHIADSDLKYLRWVVSKRNFFIHHFFDTGGWPGDLSENEARSMSRTLLYLEYIFRRAENSVYRIFQRAGLVEITDLGKDGSIVMNVDALSGDLAWLKELAIAATRDRNQRRREQKRR